MIYISIPFLFAVKQDASANNEPTLISSSRRRSLVGAVENVFDKVLVVDVAVLILEGLDEVLHVHFLHLLAQSRQKMSKFRRRYRSVRVFVENPKLYAYWTLMKPRKWPSERTNRREKLVHDRRTNRICLKWMNEWRKERIQGWINQRMNEWKKI